MELALKNASLVKRHQGWYNSDFKVCTHKLQNVILGHFPKIYFRPSHADGRYGLCMYWVSLAQADTSKGCRASRVPLLGPMNVPHPPVRLSLDALMVICTPWLLCSRMSPLPQPSPGFVPGNTISKTPSLPVSSILYPRKPTLHIHWKDWCWSWNSNTLATWCEELTHLKRPWYWEGFIPVV